MRNVCVEPSAQQISNMYECILCSRVQSYLPRTYFKDASLFFMLINTWTPQTQQTACVAARNVFITFIQFSWFFFLGGGWWGEVIYPTHSYTNQLKFMRKYHGCVESKTCQKWNKEKKKSLARTHISNAKFLKSLHRFLMRTSFSETLPRFWPKAALSQRNPLSPFLRWAYSWNAEASQGKSRTVVSGSWDDLSRNDWIMKTWDFTDKERKWAGKKKKKKVSHDSPWLHISWVNQSMKGGAPDRPCSDLWPLWGVWQCSL